jgi:hypothetical protein
MVTAKRKLHHYEEEVKTDLNFDELSNVRRQETTRKENR